MTTAAALLFTLLCALAIAFQLALLFGAPWGGLSLGGRWPGRLPPAARLLPLFSLLLLSAAAAIVLARAGLAWPALRTVAAPGIWAVVAYCGLGLIANAITPSRRERRLWLPVVALMLLSSLAVALI